jgi:hypothetical protein
MSDPTAPTTCDVPMWPNGAECVEQAGHDGPHHGIVRNIQWTYTACWAKTVIDGQEYVCLRERGHEGGHANG